MRADGATRVEQGRDPDALHRRHGARQDRVGADDLVRGGVRPPFDQRDPQAGEAVQPRGGAAGDARADDRYVECSHGRDTGQFRAMTTREKSLLLLAVAGFVVPNVMVGVFIAEHGLDLELYFESWFETLPSSQLVVDLVIAFLALVVWASWDGPRTGVDNWWVVIPASLLVGVCFALPLYLYMRERAAELRPRSARFSCALVRPTLRVKPWLRKRLVPR